jgi:hypothetical protein
MKNCKTKKSAKMRMKLIKYETEKPVKTGSKTEIIQYIVNS